MSLVVLFLSLHPIPLCRDSGTRSLSEVFQITRSWANPVELSQQMITLFISTSSAILHVVHGRILFLGRGTWRLGTRGHGTRELGDLGDSGT